MPNSLNSYEEYIREETYQKGRTFTLIGFILFSCWSIYEASQVLFTPILIFRISLISIMLFGTLGSMYFHKRNKKWIIPFYSAILSLSLLNGVLVCILIHTHDNVSEIFTANHPVGIFSCVMLFSFASLGARKICKFTFPIIIIFYNIVAIIYGFEKTQFLILINMATIFLVYQMHYSEKFQQTYYSGFRERIDKNESELSVKNEELNEANLKLKELNFTLSHDLQTPIRNIVSFSQILDRSHSTSPDKKYAEYTSYIVKSAKHMHKLIKSMQSYVDVSYGDEELNEIVEFNHLFEDLRINYASLIEEGKLTLHFQENPPKLIGNYARYYLLLQNIIDNGIKYNDEEHKTIHVTHFKDQDNIQIVIKDNGIGIEKEYQALILKPFKRLHTNEVYEGTGIGLSFCAEVMKQAGGSIKINSQIGGGSSFTLSFPNTSLGSSQPKTEQLYSNELTV